MEKQFLEPQGSLLDVLKKSTNVEPDHKLQNITPCLVKDFLWPGQIVQIKAQACGTFIACAAACAIAEGRKVLSHYECQAPAGVMILQGGMSHEHFTGRLNRLMTGTEPPLIKVISPVHFTSDAAKDVCDENVQDEFFKWLSENKAYRFVILDGVDCFLPDKPEPSQINRLLAGLRRASITVVSIESKGRGGLPLFPNQPDLILNAKALDGVDDLIIRITFEKARILRRDQQKTFFIQLQEQEDGQLSFTECPMDDFLKAKTMQLLLKGWTQQKIASETGKDQSTISRWISNTLLPDSILVKKGRNYFTTAAGDKLLQENNLMDF
jgi:hypothetical protein